MTIVADPWVVVGVVVTILLYLLPGDVDGASGLLSAVRSIAVGAVSVRGWHVFVSQNEESTVQARGRAAVRALKSLRNGTWGLRRRVAGSAAEGFFDEDCSDDTQIAVLRAALDSAASALASLEYQAVSSIENWEDVLPEADVSESIKELAETQSDLAAATSRRKELESDLKKLEDGKTTESEERVAKLEQELATATGKIRALESRARNQGAELGMPGLTQSSYTLDKSTWGSLDASTISALGSLGSDQWAGTSPIQRTCPHCKATFENANITLHAGTVKDTCPHCDKDVAPFGFDKVVT